MSVPSPPATLLYGLFFLSGAASLIFELLWFRLAALSFGSSVWAATAVLSAFMAGLALGNGLAAVLVRRLQHPLRAYAVSEGLVALSGLPLLFLLPAAGEWLSPWARPLLHAGQHEALQLLRFTSGLLLMLLPATAMGLTLPLLVQSLHGSQPPARTISRLYGANTLGAIAGVLLAEHLLIRVFGMTGSGLLAALLCLTAGVITWRIPLAQSRTATAQQARLPWCLWLAAGLCGALLLGLEVIWFRLLLLYIRGTASAFAGMLAIVLTGIALGSLLADRWFASRPANRTTLFGLAAACALSVPLGYLGLELPLPIWLRALLLMAPCALASGALLPAMVTLHAQQASLPASVTGKLWLANTAGGALGAALAGLWLLPGAGMEASLLILGLTYTGVSLLLLPSGRAWRAAGVCLLLLLGYSVFPQGRIEHHLNKATAIYRQLDQSQVIAQREGLNETVQLLERRRFGEPFSHRLVTDGYSMSGTERDSQRYMRLFAWLPQSLHAGPRDALLISYGVGTTANALLNDPLLEQLTVVDLSPDVLAMSPLIHGDDDPLEDPRVDIKIEDGRQYLLLSEKSFDLITAEPPPPRMRGVMNLYTRDYFALIHDRLKPGGLVSYWLPADQMTLESTHALLAGFCQVFSDCSLWAGSNYNWILLGGRQADAPVPADRLARLWQSSPRNLVDLGLETPALLGLTFLGDGEQLRAWYADTPPLTDHWPKRLSEQQAAERDLQAYAHWAENAASRERFAQSLWIRERFPQRWRQAALAQFELQPIFNNELPPDPDAHLPLVHELLQTSPYQTPVYWLLGSSMALQRRIDTLLEARGYQSDFAFDLGVRALVQKNFGAAASLFNEALAAGDRRAYGLAIYSLCRLGQIEAARTLAADDAVRVPFRCWP